MCMGSLCCLFLTRAGGLTIGQLLGIIFGSVIGFTILLVIFMVILIYMCHRHSAAHQSRVNVEASEDHPTVDKSTCQQ